MGNVGHGWARAKSVGGPPVRGRRQGVLLLFVVLHEWSAGSGQKRRGTHHAGGGALEDRKEGAMVEGGGRC